MREIATLFRVYPQLFNLVASHVASYTRGVLDNKTPYDSFVEKFGKDGKTFLDRLGIVKIPANEVTLDYNFQKKNIDKKKMHYDIIGTFLLRDGRLISCLNLKDVAHTCYGTPH